MCPSLDQKDDCWVGRDINKSVSIHDSNAKKFHDSLEQTLTVPMRCRTDLRLLGGCTGGRATVDLRSAATTASGQQSSINHLSSLSAMRLCSMTCGHCLI